MNQKEIILVAAVGAAGVYIGRHIERAMAVQTAKRSNPSDPSNVLSVIDAWMTNPKDNRTANEVVTDWMFAIPIQPSID